MTTAWEARQVLETLRCNSVTGLRKTGLRAAAAAASEAAVAVDAVELVSPANTHSVAA